MLDEPPEPVKVFVGAPPSGSVEIACFTLPEQRGSGHAGEITRHLAIIDGRMAIGIFINAETVPEATASTCVLGHLRFSGPGKTTDENAVWGWLGKLRSGSGGPRARPSRIVGGRATLPPVMRWDMKPNQLI